MQRVVDARYVSEHRLWLRFSDGTEGEVDLFAELQGPVFEPLRDVARFSEFVLNPDLHTVTWSTGADFAPEFLYRLIKRAA